MTTKASTTFDHRVAGWLGLIGLLLMPGTVDAAAQTGATVVGVLRKASASVTERRPVALSLGMVLPAGTTIRTGPDSAADLDLGSIAGVIRLAENTVVTIEKFDNPEPGATEPFRLELRVQQGTLLGNSRKVPVTAGFEIKVANGIVGIDQGLYRIHSQGFIVLLEGSAVFAHVVPGEKPVPYTLSAPPAVYFSPIEKIRPAPISLIDEVKQQFRSKLPRR